MIKASRILFFVFLFSLSICSVLYASSRVALVIGNGSYETSPLNNPINDAEDVSAVLQQLGFDVITKTDATKRDMIKAIDDFSHKLKKAEIGLFYYAGHGMQVNGHNYLIPVKVSITSETDVEFEAVDAGRVLGKMESAGNKLNVVILDACRNNPFARSFRSSTQGLARMDAPMGTLVVYATSPGSVAADGDGRNGIFTKHFLKTINIPDIDLQNVFNKAGIAVMAETDNKQIPWISSTPLPQYFLANINNSSQKALPPSSKVLISKKKEENLTKIKVPEEILRRGKIRVGLEPGYIPFEMTTKKGNVVGFDIDIASRIANDMGVELEIVSVPWKGIIQQLVSEKFDILISGMTITEKRSKHVDFVPYFTNGQTILIRNLTTEKIKSFKSINDHKYLIASKTGTAGESTVKNLFPNARYKGFKEENEAVKQLLRGKVDAFVYDMPYNSIVFMRYGKNKLVHLDTPIVEEIFGLAIRKNSPELSTWLTSFVDAIKTDGTYDRLYKKWFQDGNWLKDIGFK